MILAFSSKVLRSYRSRILETCINLNDVTCEQEKCNSTNPYRTFSGCCNNLEKTSWGQANTAQLMANEYEDKINIPRGGFNSSKLPSARSISTKVHRLTKVEGAPSISLMVMQFGQFLDHDITLTPEQGMKT